MVLCTTLNVWRNNDMWIIGYVGFDGEHLFTYTMGITNT
jgi:hypothetical protein